jgi:hypothetical protein
MHSRGSSKYLTDYRAETGANRAGPRPGPFPGSPGAGLGREAAQNRRFPVLPSPKKHKPKNPLDRITLETSTISGSTRGRASRQGSLQQQPAVHCSAACGGVRCCSPSAQRAAAAQAAIAEPRAPASGPPKACQGPSRKAAASPANARAVVPILVPAAAAVDAVNIAQSPGIGAP